MKKRIGSSLLSLLLVMVLICTSTIAVFAAQALPTTVNLVVDDEAAVTLHGFTVEGYDFYSLYDLAYVLRGSEKGFDIETSGDAVKLISQTPFSSEEHELFAGGQITNDASFTTQSYTLVKPDGEERRITYSVAKLDGEIFMRLADVFQIFDIYGVYRDGPEAVVIDSSKSFTTDFENIVDQGYFRYLHGAYTGSVTGQKEYFSSDKDEPVAIASTTKIMTYLLIQEALDEGIISLNDQVAVTAEAARLSRTEDRVLRNLEVGDTIPLIDLLEVMLVVSSNEAATMLGEHVAGTEVAFVAMMNEKAAELGLTSAKFYNPHGLPVYTAHVFASKLQNRMSATDLFRLSCYVLAEHPEIIEITSLESVQVESRDGYIYSGSSTNRLMFQLDHVDGLKTGTTNRSGACLVGTMLADPDDKNSRVVAVVLGAEDNMERYWKTGILLQYAKERYLADREPAVVQPQEVEELK